MPTISGNQRTPEAGGLASYGGPNDAVAPYYRAASYVDAILKGAKPSGLLVEQPLIVYLSNQAQGVSAQNYANLRHWPQKENA